MTETQTIHKAYHFTNDQLRNGQPLPAIGETLSHDGPIVPCESGLHASPCPFDVLQYAPGPILHLVELWGDIQTQGEPVDKIVGRHRRIVASIDLTDELRAFARAVALRAVENHWPKTLQPENRQVVMEYLTTGNESIRKHAVAAAGAAGDAAWAAWATEKEWQRNLWRSMVRARLDAEGIGHAGWDL